MELGGGGVSPGRIENRLSSDRSQCWEGKDEGEGRLTGLFVGPAWRQALTNHYGGRNQPPGLNMMG